MFYSPYGQRFGQLARGVTLGFAGQEHDDEIGLINMGGRMFDPVSTRFLSRDPLQAPYDNQWLNPYSYALNNPSSLVDPTGFADDDPQPQPGTEMGFDPNGLARGGPLFVPVILSMPSPEPTPARGPGPAGTGDGPVFSSGPAYNGDLTGIGRTAGVPSFLGESPLRSPTTTPAIDLASRYGGIPDSASAASFLLRHPALQNLGNRLAPFGTRIPRFIQTSRLTGPLAQRLLSVTSRTAAFFRLSIFRRLLGVASRRTVAVAKVQLGPSPTREIYAYSGEKREVTIGRALRVFLDRAEIAPNTVRVGNNGQDAEVKILDYLSTQLFPDTKGVINVFVTNAKGGVACQVCATAKEAFEARFPGVLVNFIPQ
jgi:RHS repeat-associated protein